MSYLDNDDDKIDEWLNNNKRKSTKLLDGCQKNSLLNTFISIVLIIGFMIMAYLITVQSDDNKKFTKGCNTSGGIVIYTDSKRLCIKSESIIIIRKE